LTELIDPLTPLKLDAADPPADEAADENAIAADDAALKALVALFPAAVTEEPRDFAAADTELIDAAAALLEAERATPNVFDEALIDVIVLSVCARALFKFVMPPIPVTLLPMVMLIGIGGINYLVIFRF
jgi:hypothetical protein